MRHMKHPLVVVAGAVVLLVAVRLVTAFWTWRSVFPENSGHFYRYRWIETIVDTAVWVVAVGVIVWLNYRSAKTERGRKSTDTLTVYRRTQSRSMRAWSRSTRWSRSLAPLFRIHLNPVCSAPRMVLSSLQ